MNFERIMFFISSTFIDMHEERDALQMKVLPVIRKQTANLGLVLDLCDLRWGINTGDTDETDRVSKILHVCFEEIHNCKPYMIVLLGDRYGSEVLPSDEERALKIMNEESSDKFKINDIRGKSYTELEIMFGPLMSDEQFCRTLFFFRDHIQGAISAFKGTDTDHVKSQALKNRIRQRAAELGVNNCFEYSLEWDADKNILSGIDGFCDLVQSEILHLLAPVIEEIKSLSPFERLYRQNMSLVHRGILSDIVADKVLDECKHLLISGCGTLIIHNPSNISFNISCAICKKLEEEGWKVCPYISNTDILNSGDEQYVAWAKFLDIMLNGEETLDYNQDGWLSYKNGAMISAKEGFNVLASEYSTRRDMPPLLLFYDNKNLTKDLTNRWSFAQNQGLNYKNIYFLYSSDEKDKSYLPDCDEIVFSDNDIDLVGYFYSVLKSMGKEVTKELLPIVRAKLKNKSVNYAGALLQRIRLLNKVDFSKGTNENAQYKMFARILEDAPDSVEEYEVQLVGLAAFEVDAKFCNSLIEHIAWAIGGLTRTELIDIFNVEGIAWHNDSFYAFIVAVGDIITQSSEGRFFFSNKKIAALLCDKYTNDTVRKQIYLYMRSLPDDDEWKKLHIAEYCYRENDRRYMVALLSGAYGNDLLFLKRMCVLDGEIMAWINDTVSSGIIYGGGVKLLETVLARLLYRDGPKDMERVKAAMIMFSQVKATLSRLEQARVLYLLAGFAADNEYDGYLIKYSTDYMYTALNCIIEATELLESEPLNAFALLAATYIRHYIILFKIGNYNVAWKIYSKALKYISQNAARISFKERLRMYLPIYKLWRGTSVEKEKSFREILRNLEENIFDCVCECGRDIFDAEIYALDLCPVEIAINYTDEWSEYNLSDIEWLGKLFYKIDKVDRLCNIIGGYRLFPVYVNYCRCFVNAKKSEYYETEVFKYLIKMVDILDNTKKCELCRTESRHELAYRYMICAELFAAIGKYHDSDQAYKKAELCACEIPQKDRNKQSDISLYCNHAEVLLNLNNPTEAFSCLCSALDNFVINYEYERELNSQLFFGLCHSLIKIIDMNVLRTSDIIRIMPNIIVMARYCPTMSTGCCDSSAAKDFLLAAARSCMTEGSPVYQMELAFRQYQIVSASGGDKDSMNNGRLVFAGDIALISACYDLKCRYVEVSEMVPYAKKALRSPHHRIKFAAISLLQTFLGDKPHWLRKVLRQTEVVLTEFNNRYYIANSYLVNINRYRFGAPYVPSSVTVYEDINICEGREEVCKNLYLGIHCDEFGDRGTASIRLQSCVSKCLQIFSNSKFPCDALLYARCCIAYGQLLEKIGEQSAFDYYIAARDVLNGVFRRCNNSEFDFIVADDYIALAVNMSQSSLSSYRYNESDKRYDLSFAQSVAERLFKKSHLKRYAKILDIIEKLKI